MRRYTGALLALLLLGLVPVMTGAAAERSYVSTTYGIELDGVFAGWVWSVEGGHATSDVVDEIVGPDLVARKHLAGVKYEDITVTLNSQISPQVAAWIQEMLNGKATRKNGAIIAADYNHKEQSRLNFYNALLTEVGFPALDAASKDAAKMTLKFSPEYTRQAAPSGQTVAAPKTQQKTWLPANFRLKIDGLEAAAARVNKIEALVVKQKVVEHAVGEMRDYQKEPGKLEFPNLVITFPESHADEFYKWHEDFVIKGNNGEDKEKTGTLEYLAPDMKTVLFTLKFSNLGIFRLEPEKVEAGSEQLRRLQAQMYTERMGFWPGKAQ